MKPLIVIALLVRCFDVATAETLHVGAGQPYPTLSDAVAVVLPGDVIVIHEGVYSGGLYFENVQGTVDDWIFIEAGQGETVIFNGGNNAWQFTDAAYLHIRGIIFEHQLGNGINFDDGGSYATPAHHVIFEACIFRDMDANGNNDLLKLSGLDDFQILDCLFLNGADGGSGIDMVGCHDGVIARCYFENMGSNAIQAKGGTRNVLIEQNFFRNCGQRSLNLGGSTGLQFFRPLDAEYEAADLKVYSNIFTGSVAPVAFVGCINTEVVNNTIYLPENWVLRILQETVDTSRFFPCGNNTFVNNLIVINDNVNVVCNIGPNTAPETFTFSNNLWFHSENNNWNGPVLPVTDVNNIVNADPLLSDPDFDDFTLQNLSPAIAQGLNVGAPLLDYSQNLFNTPRSIGAFEGNTLSNVTHSLQDVPLIALYPNPVNDFLQLSIPDPSQSPVHVTIRPIHGHSTVTAFDVAPGVHSASYHTGMLPPGIYLLSAVANGKTTALRFIVMD